MLQYDKTSKPSLLWPMHSAWKTIAKPAWFLQNKILYYLWESIYEDYFTHAESLIYMRRQQQQERQRIHWEHSHIEKLSRIPLDFCKINYRSFMEYSIQRLLNICSLSSTHFADKIEGRHCMGQANRNNLQSICSSNTNFSPYWSICQAP